MKTVSLKLKHIALSIFLLGFSFNMNAQCASDAITDACASQLNKDYTYLKTILSKNNHSDLIFQVYQ